MKVYLGSCIIREGKNSQSTRRDLESPARGRAKRTGNFLPSRSRHALILNKLRPRVEAGRPIGRSRGNDRATITPPITTIPVVTRRVDQRVQSRRGLLLKASSRARTVSCARPLPVRSFGIDLRASASVASVHLYGHHYVGTCAHAMHAYARATLVYAAPWRAEAMLDDASVHRWASGLTRTCRDTAARVSRATLNVRPRSLARYS